MTEQTHDWDGCLMCAVRALTEGRPKDWTADKDRKSGDTVTGVILRQGVQPTHFSDDPVPYVDLWTGGVNRVRIAGHSLMMREQIISAELQVGDTVTVTREADGMAATKTSGTLRAYKVYRITVERGHH
jgi:hypothetical protein